MVNALIITLSIVCLYYYSRILYFIFGLLKLKNNEKYYSAPVSIIVSVYNGEQSINRLLNQLKNQIYDNKIEFIIVDDMSTDFTKELIKKYVNNDNRFIYVSSESGNPKLAYKKKALDAGIKKSRYDILLFTDVDCQLNPKWAQQMISEFKDHNIEYVVGFSYVDNKYIKNLVSKFQQVDFFMLMATAFSCLKNNNPWASSGQNQAYRKKLYYDVGGFSKIKNCLQGDDTLYMQICNKFNNITCCFHQESFVITRTEYSFLSFIRQRIRWSGDANIMWKFNKSLYTMIISTFLVNTFILFSGIIIGYKLTFVCLLVKIILEYILFYLSNKKFKIDIKSIYYLWWSILQIPYVFIMGISSFFTNYLINWKSKKI